MTGIGGAVRKSERNSPARPLAHSIATLLAADCVARHHGNERKRNGVNRERKSVATENRMIRSCGHWTAIAAPRYSHRSSSVTFHDGCSHLRIRVTIRINNNEVARGLANRQQNWRLIDSCAGLRQSIALSTFGDGCPTLRIIDLRSRYSCREGQ